MDAPAPCPLFYSSSSQTLNVSKTRNQERRRRCFFAPYVSFPLFPLTLVLLPLFPLSALTSAVSEGREERGKFNFEFPFFFPLPTSQFRRGSLPPPKPLPAKLPPSVLRPSASSSYSSSSCGPATHTSPPFRADRRRAQLFWRRVEAKGEDEKEDAKGKMLFRLSLRGSVEAFLRVFLHDLRQLLRPDGRKGEENKLSLRLHPSLFFDVFGRTGYDSCLHSLSYDASSDPPPRRMAEKSLSTF